MIGLGTIINVAAIIAGGLAGVVGGKWLNERCQETIIRGMGVCVLFVGMVTAYVVSILSIRFLLSFTRRHSFKVFGWYRIVLGIMVLFLSS